MSWDARVTKPVYFSLGTFHVQDCDVHTDNISIMVECTFAINSTAPGIVVIQDDLSQYTTNRTLQRLSGDIRGSVNITDLPAGEYSVTVFDEPEDTRPAYEHHSYILIRPLTITSVMTPIATTTSESTQLVSVFYNGNVINVLYLILFLCT